VLGAPARGVLTSLKEVEDPVFADGMMGEGAALDPLEGALYAPCAGTLLKVHEARHAVVIQADNGAEILLHVGLDTVGLGGEGFETHLAQGARTSPGALLLTFDLDRLALRARSLLIPIVVINSAAFQLSEHRSPGPVFVGDPLFNITPLAPAGAASGAGPVRRRKIRIGVAHGLHARPSARITRALQGLHAEVVLSFEGRRADARSVVELMALGAGQGAVVEASSMGVDADAALEALIQIMQGAEEEANPSRPLAPSPLRRGAPRSRFGGDALRGQTAVTGVAIGRAARLGARTLLVSRRPMGPDLEARALEGALLAVETELLGALARFPPGDDGVEDPRRGILLAHLALARDPALRGAAAADIAAGAAAGPAFQSVMKARAAQLQALGDPRQAARAADLEDLLSRVLRALAGEGPRPLPPPGAIVFADVLSPSDVMELEDLKPLGFCTARGGASDHAAIIAQALGAPMAVGFGDALLDVQEGALLVLDADEGWVHVDPSPDVVERAKAEIMQGRARRTLAEAQANAPARTADGTLIAVQANLGSLADALAAGAAGADGAGLVRTEFLFQGREEPPSEDEQTALYQAIADALGKDPLVVRTFDLGADKPAPFLKLPSEDNPALGMRGIRAALKGDGLLTVQLRALLRVRAAQGRLRIMIPMVTERSELEAVRALLRAARADLGAQGSVCVGAMVETPAAALCVDLLAPAADFFSIGTNDLAQYVLAMDRGHPELARRLDGLHPGVLRLIKQACVAAAAAGRPVAVCGALGADPLAIPVLVGLGIRSVSVAVAAVPETKARLRRLEAETCRALAQEALGLTCAADVRDLLRSKLGGVLS
jgi:phosphocarrier protein FPr/phosphocarrier protein